MITKIGAEITPHNNDQASIERVAQQFEGLLLNQVMQAMRRTVPKSAMTSGFDNQVFTSMLDDELSKQMASGQGFGLAPLIIRELGGKSPTPDPKMTTQILKDGGWRRPLAGQMMPTSEQRFGAPRSGARPAACGEGHCGLDIDRPTGVSVHAARDGVVTAMGTDPNSRAGLWVELAHDAGSLTTRYLHLDTLDSSIAVGSPLNAGQVLGAVGDTGTASHGAHLHFELRVQGRYIDPESYMQTWSGPT